RGCSRRILTATPGLRPCFAAKEVPAVRSGSTLFLTRAHLECGATEHAHARSARVAAELRLARQRETAGSRDGARGADRRTRRDRRRGHARAWPNAAGA